KGSWLDAETDGGGESESGPTKTPPLPTPKWTGWAYTGATLGIVGLGFIAILGNTNVAKALIVAPVLGYIAYAVATRLAEADGQPAIVPILMGGLAVKFMGVLIRYFISLRVYGYSDATEYIAWGRKIAPGLRHLHLIDVGRLRGTNFI